MANVTKVSIFDGRWLAIWCLGIGLCACRATANRGQPPSLPADPPADPPKPPQLNPELGFDPGALDTSVAPCEDFYRYACGGWLSRTSIPPDRSSWSRSFSVIQERNQDILHEILDAYAAGKVDANEPDATRVGDFYAACMDEASVEREGDDALTSWQAVIGSIADLTTLASVVRWMHDRDFNVFFSFGPDQDFHDATKMIGEVDQAGLGLPDREDYLKQEPASQQIREAYRAHIARMMVLAGEPSEKAAASADIVLAIETELARASMPRVEHRDPENIYHRLDRMGLEDIAPSFPWRSYFADNLSTVQAINVTVPDFFRSFSRLLQTTTLDKLQTYLRWHVVSDHAMDLGRRFVNESFAFSSKNLTGAQVLLPRWKRCAGSTESALGEAVAQPFVKRTFPAGAKGRSLDLIQRLENAFARNLDQIPWMDAPTRAAASNKLHAVYDKIGYPDTWRSYQGVAVDRTRHAQNVLSAAKFESDRQYAKIDKPVDRAEWAMSPITVNAYYNPLLNEMVFPAGILQAPFFRLGAVPADNYGGIGTVMGHELTHGFDDQGRRFDKDGNLRNWWSPAALQAFRERTDCVVRQYQRQNAYENVPLNGKLTLGENIADLGGVKLAFRALTSTAGPDHAPSNKDDLPQQQRFFLAFAQSWCTHRRPELARTLAVVDPHAPPRIRVNVSLSNLPEFAAAFKCPAGEPMAPAERCSVW
jgi:putative endopeptidase